MIVWSLTSPLTTLLQEFEAWFTNQQKEAAAGLMYIYI